MTEPRELDAEDAKGATPYRPEDFIKVQYVPPTRMQREWSKLKIVGAVTGVMVVLAMCARVAGIA